MNVVVRLLEPSDERTNFRSGNAALDEFFQRFAGQNHFRHHYGATYVALLDAVVMGYATVAAGSIGVELAGFTGRRPPGYPLPVLRLGRLAVDDRYQGHGIGKQLLKHVLTVAVSDLLTREGNAWNEDETGLATPTNRALTRPTFFLALSGAVAGPAVDSPRLSPSHQQRGRGLRSF